jgi:cytochrome d ubiquinol oxidase subunit II
MAALVIAGLCAYGVLAGADFGGGILDALARGPRRDAQRDAIARAMGPVWEANHVWLIFVIVLLFSGFPRAFYALGEALFVPFHLALVGITLRGGAFVFRAYGPSEASSLRRWGRVFGIASVCTPVLLGMCLGAVSSGRIRARYDGELTAGADAWHSPLALVTGLFALALCAYLAAVFLTVETDGDLRDDFRRHALEVGTVVVALSAALIPWVFLAAPHLGAGLLSARALPVLLLGALAALASGYGLYRRRFALARAAAVAQVACLLAGWGLAQYPFLIYPDVSLVGSAAPAATLAAILWTIPPGLALLLPALWWLFRVFKSPP